MGLIVLGTLRVAELQRAERTIETHFATLRARMHEPQATRISARIGSAQLLAEQEALFELCAAQDLRKLRGAFELVVLHVEATRVMLRVALDHAHLANVKGDAAFSCLVLGSGLLEHGGEYSVEAVWRDAPPTAADVLDIELALRVLAKPRLNQRDFALVAALGCALLGALLGLVLRASPLPAAQPVLESATPDVYEPEAAPVAEPAPKTPRLPTSAIIAPCAGLALVYASMDWMVQGALFTLLKGLGMAALQIGLAFALAWRWGETNARVRLGLGPARGKLALAGVVCAWPCLVLAARVSLYVVPSTGEAPIQTFVSWPSGMLTAALLGALLPAAEELFFRGYVYGTWLRFGKLTAAVSSVLVFGILHAQQSWGNWGGLVAVFVTGAAMCALRMFTGSTWLAALCHLAYNLTLSLGSMSRALSE